MMARRTFHWYLHKVNRISGYLLFVVIALMIVSGLATAGRHGFDRVLSLEEAMKLHTAMRWPVIGLFLIHASVSWYFSFRRWGWIK